MSISIFAKYEIIRRLAIGGMGEIFLARQSGEAGFDRLVVLKTLLPELTHDASFVAQFLEEARVAATLNHPNIVAVHEVGCWEGVYFIAMEYIHGESIWTLMRVTRERGQLVPLPVTARIVRDAALGLDHAHHASDVDGRLLSIVHRDVSPQNIMVRIDGVTKVVDFGIARAANRVVQTRTGFIKGKLRYMSPEQVARQAVDGRADQYALGIVLWELLTGEGLFPVDEDELTLLERVHEEPVPLPSSRRLDVSADMDRIVHRMTEREPQARYPQFAHVAADLDLALGRMQGTESTALSTFVQQTLGESIERRTEDLTPRPEPFLISLKPAVGTEDPTVPAGGSSAESTASVPDSPERQTSRRPIVGRVVAAAALLIALTFGLAAVLNMDEPPFDVHRTNDVSIEPGGGQKWTEPAKRPNAVSEEPSILVLTSTPPGAMVRQGDLELGNTPLRTDSLSPDGEHVLRLARRGYRDVEVTVEVDRGATRELHVTLNREAPTRKTRRSRKIPMPPVLEKEGRQGFLTLKSSPWVAIQIDGTPHGYSPVYRVELKPGKHTLRLVNEAKGIDVTREVAIRSGETTKLDLDLDRH